MRRSPAQHTAAAGAPKRILTMSGALNSGAAFTNIPGDWLELLDASADISVSFDQGAAVPLFPGEIYHIPFAGFVIAPNGKAQWTVRIGQGGAKPIVRQRLPRRFALITFADVALLGGARKEIWGTPLPGQTNAFMDLLICPTVDCRIGDSTVGATAGVLIAANTVLRVPAQNSIWAFSTPAGSVSITGIAAQ